MVSAREIKRDGGGGDGPGAVADSATVARTGAWGEACAGSPTPPGPFPALLAVLALAAAPPFDEIRPVVERHCGSCHGSTKPKGGLDLARFRADADVLADRATWKRVLDEVRGRTMPPSTRPQLPDADYDRLIDYIEAALGRPGPDGVRDPGKPVLRRLTRLEYNNTVRDLLGLTTDLFMLSERLPVKKAYFDPAAGVMPERVTVATYEYGAKQPAFLPSAGLPGDNRAEHGFTNRGDSLNVSPLLLEKYVALAREIADHPRLADASPVMRELLADPSGRPETAAAPAKPGLTVPAVAAFDPRRKIPAIDGGIADAVATAFAQGRGGVIDMEVGKHTVVAAKAGLRVPFGPDAAKALAVTADANFVLSPFTSVEPTSGRMILTNAGRGDKRLTLSFTVTGGRPGEGVTTFAGAVLSRKAAAGPVRLTAVFDDGTTDRRTIELPEGAGSLNTAFAFAAPAGRVIVQLAIDGDDFSGDHVVFDDLAFVTGERTVRPETPVAPGPTARQRLAAFLPKAFRRPVTADELDRYTHLFDSRVSAGDTFTAAMRAVLRTVLASPHFLYIAERADATGPAVRDLDDFELANRLSYFLWATAPDEELTRLAAAGRLRDSAVFDGQVRRMLRDKKVRELSDCFAVQWLRLNELTSARPDPKRFKLFYGGPQGKDSLAVAMLIEGLLLFETVLIENRPVLDFIDPGFTYVNPRLRKLYESGGSAEPGEAVASAMGNRELPADAKNNDWFRTPLTDRDRGGILTMAGPLTLTSLPGRTSPVKRGAWVLETVFHRPPPPPNVAVEPLEAVQGGSEPLSVRQKLELHRTDAACAACHARIDPPGFALETFDPIGAWRTTDNGVPIDAKGRFPGGRDFDGPAALKDVILSRRDEFVRGFAEQMLSYALGRALTFADAHAVNGIVAAAKADGYRIHAVIRAVAASEPFRKVNQDSSERGALAP